MSEDEQEPTCPILVSGEEEANILNYAGLARVLKEISYPIPANAERVPWLERLDVQSQEKISDEIDPLADVARENAFFDLALNGAREGLKKLTYLGVPFVRPPDFLAEMLKSDELMRKIGAKLSSQTLRMKAVAERKQRQIQRKFASQAKVAQHAKEAKLKTGRKNRSHQKRK